MGCFDAIKPPSKISCLGTFQRATGSDQPFRRQSRSNHLTINTTTPSGSSYDGGAYLVSTFKNIFPGTVSSVGEVIKMSGPLPV